MCCSHVSDRRVVVSITPVPLSRDARTLRQAASLARCGYESVVVADGQRWSLSCGPMSACRGGESTIQRTIKSGNLLYRVWRRLREADLPHLVQLPVFCFWLLRYLYRHVWRVARCLPPASLYCLHEFSAFPAVWYAARRARAPIVYDCHDLYLRIDEREDKPPFEQRFLLPFHRWLERLCTAHAAVVFTVSPTIAKHLNESYGVEPRVLRNCHDNRIDSQEAENIRSRLGVGANVFLMVTVGTCKKGQRILSALDAMVRLPSEVHLAVIGDGYEGFVGECKARGLLARVHFLGHIDPTHLVPSIRTANAALILYYARSVNYAGALPNGLFQCIAAELPVLYPNLPEIGSLMRENQAGICIDPGDPRSIIDGVNRLIEDPNACGSVAVRRQLRERYSWRNEERVFLEEVGRLAHQRSTYTASGGP